MIITLRGRPGDEAWCTRLRTEAGTALLDLGLPGVAVNVRDAMVTESLMTLTTLDPPVIGVVSLWTQQCYGQQIRTATAQLSRLCDEVAAYLVTESVPLVPPNIEPGLRTPGFANVALLRRPADLAEATWRDRWQLDHTRVAIDTQATFGYTQNAVVRALTAHAPPIAAIVEELFPAEAISDLHAFFGAADDAELDHRMTQMMASTAAFGANRDLDTVPTSRYVLRTPFCRLDTLQP